MNIVAVYNLEKDEERLSKALAAALGKTAYEARSLLNVPQGGPSIVAVFQEPEKSEDSAAKLRANGFDAVILRDEDIESDKARFLAVNFEFTGESLNVKSREGQDLILPYGDIRLMLYGIVKAVHTTNEKVKERKFSMGRAIMSSGAVITKTTSRQVSTEKKDHERFLYIYAPARQTVVLREYTLKYDSLGKALQLSRTANFNYIVAELKRLSPDALFDDRFLNRATQTQILWPWFNPEEHLDIATSLLAKVFNLKNEKAITP
ncbi:MAG: hypothetical protein HZC48_13715 [Nitrospirae bacterium]|nr:hypothetical protein [Nitrospirota bacterium]